MKNMRIAELLFNRPLMISEPKLNTLLHIFGKRSGLDLVGLPPAAQMAEVSESVRKSAGYVVKNGVGIIGIFGPLMHRVLAMEFPSGGPMTYADVRHAFDIAMEDSSVHTVAGLFGTPGGEVSGAFDLSDHIFQSRGKKPLLAIVDEQAFSSGYLLASAFDRIVIPRTGGVGSIGVIASHADFSRAEDAAGVTVTHVFAGARKADFSPHQPLSSEALGNLQGMVDDNYGLFVETVARNRGMTAKQVRETEAGMFEGKKAVAMKLADEVSAVDKALANAANKKTMFIVPGPRAGGQKETQTMKTVAELREALPDLVAQVETEARAGMISAADAATATATAVSAESTRVLGLVTACFGEEPGKKLTAIAGANLSADQAKELGITIAPAASTEQAKMLAAITGAAADGVKPAKVEVPAAKGSSLSTSDIYASRQKALKR